MHASSLAMTESSSAFAGKQVVITGTLVTMTRDEAERRLAAAGAIVGNSVTKKTQLLIHGDKAGSKLAKARSLGVPLMTEREMVALLLASPDASSGMERAAAQLSDADAEMASVRAKIDAANARYVEAYGMTVPKLLMLWFRLFAKRGDVFVRHCELGAPASNKTMKRLEEQVPAEWLAVRETLGAVRFAWVFQRNKSAMHEFSEGYNGGRLALVDPEKFQWWPIQNWQKERYDFYREALFDEFVAEGLTKLEYKKRQKPAEATLVFDNANDCVRHPVGTPLEYLTNGARSAFTWYWQVRPNNEFTASLYEASLPIDASPADIEAHLVSLGATEDEARALQRWLGSAAVLLCYRPLSAERERRKTLALTFEGADSPSSRRRNFSASKPFIGDPMPPREIATMLAAHESFLRSGGRGGSWQMLSVSDLPLCVYLGPKAKEGTQLVLRLKSLAKRSLNGAELSYADLSGSCCDEASFEGARLECVAAIDASFERAKFDKALLRNADFSGSQMQGASFRDADCSYADFEGADLTGADFRGAKLDGAKFPGATLDGVRV